MASKVPLLTCGDRPSVLLPGEEAVEADGGVSSGLWVMTHTPTQKQTVLAWKQEGSTLVGKVQNADASPIKGKISGQTCEFTMGLKNDQDSSRCEGTFSKDGDSITGKLLKFEDDDLGDVTIRHVTSFGIEELIVRAAGHKMVEGKYRRIQNEMKNSWPVWKKTDSNHRILRDKRRGWLLVDDSIKDPRHKIHYTLRKSQYINYPLTMEGAEWVCTSKKAKKAEYAPCVKVSRISQPEAESFLNEYLQMRESQGIMTILKLEQQNVKEAVMLEFVIQRLTLYSNRMSENSSPENVLSHLGAVMRELSNVKDLSFDLMGMFREAVESVDELSPFPSTDDLESFF